MRHTFFKAGRFAVILLQLIGDTRLSAHATTVRYPNEFRYDVNGTHHSLWYVHEQWDIDPFGFVIDCDEENTAYLTVTYNLIKNGNRTIDLKRMKQRNIKPALVIRAGSERIKNIGQIDIEEENSAEVLRYQILNGTDLRDLILRKDVVFEFPNSTVEIWNINNSEEITKFFGRCAPK